MPNLRRVRGINAYSKEHYSNGQFGQNSSSNELGLNHTTHMNKIGKSLLTKVSTKYMDNVLSSLSVALLPVFLQVNFKDKKLQHGSG